MVIIVQLIMQ